MKQPQCCHCISACNILMSIQNDVKNLSAVVMHGRSSSCIVVRGRAWRCVVVRLPERARDRNKRPFGFDCFFNRGRFNTFYAVYS